MTEATENDFDTFFARHLRLCYGAAFAATRNAETAEDIAQEALLRAWRRHDLVLPLALPAQRAWLLTTVRHLVVDRARRAKSYQPLDTCQDLADGNDPQTALRLDVTRALSHLPASDREIAVLRYLEELNSREIGETLGMPDGTVRRRLVVIRERLARLLCDWKEDE